MKCEDCGDLLQVRRTIQATPSSKTNEAVCVKCGEKWTIITFVSHKAVGSGNGAHATAKKISKGQLTPNLQGNGHASRT